MSQYRYELKPCRLCEQTHGLCPRCSGSGAARSPELTPRANPTVNESKCTICSGSGRCPCCQGMGWLQLIIETIEQAV